ncbi:MAG: tRNA (adenosine(37)-N6)-threonylcarbamoyltransferase complex ATPase subunit type 1 TsaE [Lachnospiraceae bacterium]|nr:tRNA (adenosine(37)-N6)-threonylcarbamoyltransferase complex ATPase subunit type 1 TsaE [Lachnospiraceae bacterium]
MRYETFCAEETFAIGKRLGESAAAGQIYTLTGDLGVGKTVFTQGFAAGLSVAEPVNSPTFTVVQVYDTGRLPLYHFDAYRIGDVTEMDEIGYEDYFFGDGVCLIEWADLIREIIPAGASAVTIEKEPARGTDYRTITIEGPELQPQGER